MAGPQYHHITKQGSQPYPTQTEQNQPLFQPQALIAPERAEPSIKGPLWMAKLNLRLLSMSIDTILLIIVFALAAGSRNNTAAIILFGPLAAIAFAWSFADLLYIWTERRCSSHYSTRLYIDAILSFAFVASSAFGGYFGPADHPATGSAPSKDESHLGTRALGCFGIAEVFVHMLSVAIAYHERKSQANEPLPFSPLTSRGDTTRRSEENTFRDEEEGLLVDQEPSSDR
ncbi:hypothetical protein FOQG_18639 [Fusarium oxysporum f. sp. raphani 54005]|uniref:MARVEL domain-containing protein n=1 Tax=Fusarium oxysporum f. sp. raphani 54005 TaxID=1089458 RepID=X0B4D8_FUSOX|nr:hypothetical protein FOQG_18639 [Fusarium oxysporum f. sp. raphani 54005]